MAHKEGAKNIYLQIHEVYYNNDGKPTSYTENAVGVGGDNVEGITWVLEMMSKCLEKPVLWAGENFPQEYKNK